MFVAHTHTHTHTVFRHAPYIKEKWLQITIGGERVVSQTQREGDYLLWVLQDVYLPHVCPLCWKSRRAQIQTTWWALSRSCWETQVRGTVDWLPLEHIMAHLALSFLTHSQLRHLKDRMKEVMNCVQIIEKKMDAVKVTKSKVCMESIYNLTFVWHSLTKLNNFAHQNRPNEICNIVWIRFVANWTNKQRRNWLCFLVS